MKDFELVGQSLTLLELIKKCNGIKISINKLTQDDTETLINKYNKGNLYPKYDIDELTAMRNLLEVIIEKHKFIHPKDIPASLDGELLPSCEEGVVVPNPFVRVEEEREYLKTVINGKPEDVANDISHSISDLLRESFISGRDIRFGKNWTLSSLT